MDRPASSMSIKIGVCLVLPGVCVTPSVYCLHLFKQYMALPLLTLYQYTPPMVFQNFETRHIISVIKIRTVLLYVDPKMIAN